MPGTYRRTALACTFGTVLLVASVVFNLSPVPLIIELLHQLQEARVAELMLVFLLVTIGFYFDLREKAKEKDAQSHIQAQRLRVLRATMVKVQDIVNGFVACVRVSTLDMPIRERPEALQRLEIAIDELSWKLRGLQRLTETPERKISEKLCILDVSDAVLMDRGMPLKAARQAEVVPGCTKAPHKQSSRPRKP